MDPANAQKLLFFHLNRQYLISWPGCPFLDKIHVCHEHGMDVNTLVRLVPVVPPERLIANNHQRYSRRCIRGCGKYSPDAYS